MSVAVEPEAQTGVCLRPGTQLEQLIVILQRLNHAIVLSQGWRRALIAFVAGAVSVLALAPINAWPVLFLTFPVLVWLIDGAAGRWGGVWSAFATGWWFGFGYLLFGLYWVGHAFLVDAQTFGWLLPFAVTALPAAFAIYTAVGVALARLLWTRGAAAYPGARRGAHRHGVAARASVHRLSRGMRSATRSRRRSRWRRAPRWSAPGE